VVEENSERQTLGILHLFCYRRSLLAPLLLEPQSPKIQSIKGDKRNGMSRLVPLLEFNQRPMIGITYPLDSGSRRTSRHPAAHRHESFQLLIRHVKSPPEQPYCSLTRDPADNQYP
jgi:hypothetical protein